MAEPAKVVSIDPSDVDPVKAGSKAVPINPEDVDSGPSVMDPHPVESGLKRIGKAVTDPKTIAKFAVGTALPVAAGAAAGAATEGTMSEPAAALTRTAVQGIAGALTPYAQYLTGEAMGEQLPPPSVRDALHSAAFNAGMAGIGEFAGGGSASAVKPEMEGAPKTISQLKQAVRNREFWKSAGLDDDKITSILKLPEDEKNALAMQIQAGRETKQAFQNVVDNTRADFKTRYDTAQGPQANAEIDTVPVADAIVKQLQQGEHVLTPSYSNFLKKKLSDLSGIDMKTMQQMDFPNSLVDTKSPYHQAATKMWDQAEVQARSPQELRDIRTELRENVPAQGTNLDNKAAAQLNDAVTQTYENGLRDAGATSEQIGALRGIDEDYGRWQGILKTLDPRDEKYGDKVAGALFDPMTKNPSAGLEFINLAKAADKGNPGTMDKLREAFNMRALQQSSRGAPIDQMEILRTLQKQWGDQGSRTVLAGLYGKDSPWADPALFAKTLALPVKKDDITQIASWAQRVQNVPWLVRLGAISAVTGGGIMAATRDPTKAAEAVATILGIGFAGKIMGKLDPIAQKAYVNFKLNPTPASFKNFMRTSGAMIGATAEMPTQSEDSR